jgi:hypothetical protein
MNIKVKRKRDTGGIVFDNVIESIDLIKEDKNIYERNRKYNSFILLNIPEDEDSFKEFIREKYKAVDVNLSGVSDFTNYKVYCTKYKVNIL